MEEVLPPSHNHVRRSLQRAVEGFLTNLLEIMEHRSGRGGPAVLGPGYRDAVAKAFTSSSLATWAGCDWAGPTPDAPQQPGEPALRLAQADAPAITDRRQAFRLLFDALTGRITVSAETLRSLTSSADWPDLPRCVQLVAVADEGGAPRVLPRRSILVNAGQGELNVLVPDPEGRRPTTIQKALEGRMAVIGPVVDLAEAGTSLRWARRLFAIRREQQPLGGSITYVEDQVAALLLLQDEALAAFAHDKLLKPMSNLTYYQREQLSETLAVWVACGGPTATAKALGVHPQTVRYRIRKLEKLFGSALYDPRVRFELQVAARIHLLAPGLRRSHQPAHDAPGPDTGRPRSPLVREGQSTAFPIRP
ncbi:PucR family transcriptional regulator [Kitasatospora sp. NPDC059827]|uniref:PucR family transcriptional regulator n=1 Tax=Kitasatospora sp. NPDC059827 TaxID=3346964 RepID=UPI003665F588